MTFQRSENQRSSRNTIIGGVVAVVALVAAVFIVITLFDQTADEADPADPQLGVTAGEIVENPDEHRDDVVLVAGEVNQVFGTFAYSIGGDRFADGHELLIIGPPPPVGQGIDDEDPLRQEEVFEEDLVQVSGRVMDFDLDEIEEEIGAEIEGDIPEELQQQPILLAEGQVVTQRLTTEVGAEVEIDDILADPNEYMDEPITVVGEISEPVGETAFLLDDALLVVDGSETLTEEAVEEAESIEETGYLVMFDEADLEDEAGVDVDIQQPEEFEGQPVLIAEALLILPPEA